jgi:excinuclease ABC subunit A
VIKTADWVLDLGPGGGVNGGEIVAEGTPEKVAAEPRSFTGQYLAPLLSRFAPPAVASEPARPKRKSSARTALENAK